MRAEKKVIDDGADDLSQSGSLRANGREVFLQQVPLAQSKDSHWLGGVTFKTRQGIGLLQHCYYRVSVLNNRVAAVDVCRHGVRRRGLAEKGSLESWNCL